MNRPTGYLSRMVLFVAIVGVGVFLLYQALLQAFMANPLLNGIIVGVLVLGVGYTFRQVLTLNPEVSWLETFRRDPNSLTAVSQPRLLAPMASMLSEHQGRLRLSAPAMRSLLDGISLRLEESRDISRYMMRLLIFLGLLGTFWGLLQTVSAIVLVIENLFLGSGDVAAVFEDFKAGLLESLQGAGTAFSTSLFGLGGSLVLGFLDLQAGQAQNRFYNDLEDWLSGQTRLTGSGPVVEGDHAIPAYIQALLEQTAESLDELQRAVAQGESDRASANTHLIGLAEKLGTLTDQMKTGQSLMLKLAETQIELKGILERLAEGSGQNMLDDATRDHIRNIDVYMARLVEETTSGRAQTVQELRSEIKLLARTIAATDSRAKAAQ